MLKKIYLLLIITLLLSIKVSVFASESKRNSQFEQTREFIKLINFEQPSDYVKNVSLTRSTFMADFSNASQKFSQSNITTSYKDFLNLIHKCENNDFIYMNLVYELCSVGFFSLSQNAILKIEDVELWQKQIDWQKKAFFPGYTLSYEEEIYLAQLFADINYNNLVAEAISDLVKNDKLLKKSDYANYLLAQAYFTQKEYSKALGAINKALVLSNNKYNYLKFKTTILCENKNEKEALKLINNMQKDPELNVNFSRSLDILETYILSKNESDKNKAKFYNAKYTYLNGDYGKTIRIASQITAKNKRNYMAMTLLGDAYLKTSEITKAAECYEKAHKTNKKYAPALIGLANVEFGSKDFEKALNYCHQALKYDKNNSRIYVKCALAYKETHNNIKAREMAQKALSLEPNSFMAYYALSKIDTENKNKKKYLKTALSINPMFTPAWLDLAELETQDQNLTMAKYYILPAKYLKPDDSSYFYTQTLIDKENNTDKIDRTDESIDDTEGL